MGYGNLTRLNIPNGDFGGELDPHGATGAGNPVGGNVTTNMTVDGQTINVAEWMVSSHSPARVYSVFSHSYF